METIQVNYRNRKNKKFGYAYTPDAEVSATINRIKQKPDKYGYEYAKGLARMLDENKHPSALEGFIIVLKEIDKNNFAKWQDKAEKLLKKFHEFEYDMHSKKFYKK